MVGTRGKKVNVTELLKSPLRRETRKHGGSSNEARKKQTASKPQGGCGQYTNMGTPVHKTKSKSPEKRESGTKKNPKRHKTEKDQEDRKDVLDASHFKLVVKSYTKPKPETRALESGTEVNPVPKRGRPPTRSQNTEVSRKTLAGIKQKPKGQGTPKPPAKGSEEKQDVKTSRSRTQTDKNVVKIELTDCRPVGKSKPVSVLSKVSKVGEELVELEPTRKRTRHSVSSDLRSKRLKEDSESQHSSSKPDIESFSEKLSLARVQTHRDSKHLSDEVHLNEPDSTVKTLNSSGKSLMPEDETEQDEDNSITVVLNPVSESPRAEHGTEDSQSILKSIQQGSFEQSVTPDTEEQQTVFEQVLKEEDVDNVIVILPQDKSDEDTDKADMEKAVLNYLSSQKQQPSLSPRKPPSPLRDGEVSIDGLNNLEVLVQVAAQEETSETMETERATQRLREVSGNDGESLKEAEEYDAKSALPLRVLVPHVSIRPLVAPSPLQTCTDLECQCCLVHCPLCEPGSIGVAPMRTMVKHFNLHMKRGLTYGAHQICLCMLACNSEPHLHCPMCGEVLVASFHHISPFLMHLTSCEHRANTSSDHGVEVRTNSRTKSVTVKEPSQTSARLSALIVPHVSILRQDERLKIRHCHSGLGCDCALYHCPLCPIDRATFRFPSKASQHVDYHMKHCVDFQGYKILICQLPCAMFSHYHCPTCGNLFRRKIDASRHVTSSCKGFNRKRRMRKNLLPAPEEFNSSMLGAGENSGESPQPSFFSKFHDSQFEPPPSRDGSVPKVDFPHNSIILKDENLKPWLCDRKSAPDCHCSMYHCSLCPKTSVKIGPYCKAKDHVYTHYKRALPFKEHLVLPCGFHCVKNKTKGYHYHCPNCGVTIVVLEQFKQHLYKNCKTSRCYTDNVYTNPTQHLGKRSRPALNSHSEVEQQTEYFEVVELEEIQQELVQDQVVQQVSEDEGKVEDPPLRRSARHADRIQTSTEAQRDMTIATDSGSTVEREDQDQVVKVETADPQEQVKKEEISETSDSPETSHQPLQILRSVSAEVTRSQLLAVACVEPRELMEALRQYTSISWQEDGDNFMLRGSWGQLENASTILANLISQPPETAGELHAHIRENGAEPLITEKTPEGDGTDQKSDIPTGKSLDTLAETTITDEAVSVELRVNDNEDQDKLLLEAIKQHGARTPPVRCFSCQRTFVILNNLIIHLLSSHSCQQQNAIDKLPPGFRMLVEAINAVKSLQCPDCKRRFIQKVHCISHYLKKTCKRTWLSEKIRDYDIKVNPLADLYTCPQCMYSSQSKLSIVNHYEQSHTELLFPCTWTNCKKSYGSQQSLDIHVNLRHVNPQKQLCPVCGISLQKGALNHHVISKHSDVSLLPAKQCPHCTYSNWSETNLQNHISNMHSEKVHQCPHCNKSFGRQIKLKQHINTVHHKRRHQYNKYQKSIVQCPQCRVKLYQRNLVKHIQTVHEQRKQYSCNKCGKVFPTKKARWTHSLTHLVNSDNERVYLYRCATCLKGFNRKWWFTEHVQYAHSNARYTCDVCAKSFRFKLLYDRHILSHEDLGTSCDFCHEVFSDTRQLRAHLRSKHNTTSVVSCACGLNFASMEGYQGHSEKCKVRLIHLDSEEMAEEEAAANEILAAEGIQYSSSVVDENGVVLPYVTYEAGPSTDVAPRHLEAAQTLESISLKADSADYSTEGTPEESGEYKQVVISSEDLLAHSGMENVIVKNEDGEHLVTVSEDFTEMLIPNDDSQAYREVPDNQAAMVTDNSTLETVVLRTDTGQEVTVLVPDGHKLSEEDTKNIVLEMASIQEGETQQVETVTMTTTLQGHTESAVKEEEQVVWSENDMSIPVDEVEDVAMETVDQSEDVVVMYMDQKTQNEAPESAEQQSETANGFMCGMCSEIFSSLESVEQHIVDSHSHEIPQE